LSFFSGNFVKLFLRRQSFESELSRHLSKQLAPSKKLQRPFCEDRPIEKEKLSAKINLSEEKLNDTRPLCPSTGR